MNDPIPTHVTRGDGLGSVAPSILLRLVRSLSDGVVQRRHDSMDVSIDLGKDIALRAPLPLKQPAAPAANSNQAT